MSHVRQFNKHLSRVTRFVFLNRQFFSAGDGMCTNSSDCYPVDLQGSSVPTKYINCSDQKCVCSDCFYATNSYKSCAYQRCWEYDNTTQTCNDLRKSQKNTVILSIFLSCLGVANFYIGQNDKGTYMIAWIL